MKKNNLTIALAILQRTHDGRDLSHQDLQLVDTAISGYLEENNAELVALLESVKKTHAEEEEDV